MTDLALAYTPATELARRIRAKEISPVEVIDNALAHREPRRLLYILGHPLLKQFLDDKPLKNG